jgi:hypothetical protein
MTTTLVTLALLLPITVGASDFVGDFELACKALPHHMKAAQHAKGYADSICAVKDVTCQQTDGERCVTQKSECESERSLAVEYAKAVALLEGCSDTEFRGFMATLHTIKTNTTETPAQDRGRPQSQVAPFTVECTEGETHRYDGGNAKDAGGNDSQGLKDSYGWKTEKWGDLSIVWLGGETVSIGNLSATVIHARNGIMSAVVHDESTLAVNVRSLILDIPSGQAVFNQVQAAPLGRSRSIKARSQDLRCKVTPLK